MRIFIYLWLFALVCLILYVARVWFTSPEYRKKNFDRTMADLREKERRDADQ